MEISKYHDAQEQLRHQSGKTHLPGQLFEVGEALGQKSTRSVRGDTISIYQGMKSIRDTTDAPGVEDSARPMSKTFVRPSSPQELLDYPVIMNQRVSMNIFTMAPL